MKRISIIGLCLMAVMAVSAVSVASSSAALPEYKSAGGFPYILTFSSALPLSPAFKSSILETAINCQMTVGSGEVESFKAFSKIKIYYDGCKENGTSNVCTTVGQAAGTVVTNELLARIGYVGGLLARKVVGTELEPVPPNKVFTTFTCAGLGGKVTVEGCTIGETKPINVDQATGSLLFWENAGLNGQLYTLVDEGTHHPCELTVTATAFELKGKGWIMDDELETFSANIELKA